MLEGSVGGFVEEDGPDMVQLAGMYHEPGDRETVIISSYGIEEAGSRWYIYKRKEEEVYKIAIANQDA